MSDASKANARRVIAAQKLIAYRKLSWGEFVAKVPAKKNAPDDAAFSKVGIIMGWTSLIDPMVQGQGGPGGYGGTYYKARVRDVTFAAVFLPSASWREAKMATDLTLAHEQGHFDLVEITARLVNSEEAIARIREQYTDTGPTPAAAEEQLRQRLVALANEYTEEANRYQKAYDDETGHGTDPVAQKAHSAAHSGRLAQFPSYW